MGRPKKNGVEMQVNAEDDKLPLNEGNAQQNAINAAETQKEQTSSLIEVADWAAQPFISADMSVLGIVSPSDIEVRKGRMYIDTGITINEGYFGLIFPTPDNAAYGLKTETDYRLTHSDVIPMRTQGKVKLVLNIDNDTVVQEHTNFGSRSRNLVIPEGTPLAELVIFKL